MADRYLYGSVSSPAAGANVRVQLAAGDLALMGGFKRGTASVEIDGSSNVLISSGVAGYSLVNGVYYVRSTFANRTAFQSLLQALQTAGTDAEIVLDGGLHQITWTTAQTLSGAWKIRGEGGGALVAGTQIQFVGNNVNTCLNFTGRVNISGITFERTVQMLNQGYGVQLGVASSVIRDCCFKVDPQAASSNAISIVTAATDCLIDNVLFTQTYAKTAHILSTAERTVIRNCKAVVSAATCDSTYAVILQTTAHYSVIEGCYFQSRDGSATATPLLYIAGDYCNIDNTTVEAGETDSAGHGVFCLNISGDYVHISNSSFTVKWDTATSTLNALSTCSGVAVTIVNCRFSQKMYRYTDTSSNANAILGFSRRCHVTNCSIYAYLCKGAIVLSGTADYSNFSNNYIRGTRAYTGGTYYNSSLIWIQLNCDYCTIVGNYFASLGSTSGWAMRNTGTANACSSWTIADNIIDTTGGTLGIQASHFTESNISGNTATAGGNSINSTNTNNNYGTGNTTAPGNNR